MREPQIVYLLHSNLCVRVFVSEHACAHACIDSAHAPMRVCMGAWVSVWVCVRLLACVWVEIGVCLCVCVCMHSHTHPRLFPMTSTSGGLRSIPRWQSIGPSLHQRALRVFSDESGSLLFTKSRLFIKSFTSFRCANSSRHRRITLAIHTSKGFDFPLPFRCVQQY